MNKVLIMPLKSLGLLGAMTMEWQCVFNAFFHKHIKDWWAKVSSYKSLRTVSFYKSWETIKNLEKILWNTCKRGFILTGFANLHRAAFWKS